MSKGLQYGLEELSEIQYEEIKADSKTYYTEINLDVIIGEEVISLDDYIKYFAIYSLYNSCVIPFIKVTVTPPATYYQKICENYENCKFRLNMNLVDRTDCDTSGSYFSNGISDPIIKNLIVVPNDFNNKQFQTQYNYDVDASIEMDLELFAKKHLELSRKTYRLIYSDTNLKSIILSLISGKTLFSKPNNTTKYKQIMINSQNIFNIIKGLQNVYGIYRTGLRLFFDFDRNYCLAGDYKYNAVQVEDGGKEWQNTIVYVGKVDVETDGCYKDKENQIYYVLTQDTQSYLDNETSAKESYGEDITVRNTTQDSNTISKNSVTNTRTVSNNSKDSSNTGTSKSKDYYAKYDNPYLEESLKAEAQKAQFKYIATFRNIDLSYISINKLIYLKFIDNTSSDYDGTYQVESMVTNYEQISKGIYSTEAKVTLCRLSKGFLSDS